MPMNINQSKKIEIYMKCKISGMYKIIPMLLINFNIKQAWFYFFYIIFTDCLGLQIINPEWICFLVFQGPPPTRGTSINAPKRKGSRSRSRGIRRSRSGRRRKKKKEREGEGEKEGGKK